ncbi:RTA1 like protein [Schizopora paradoxa]|uniref:RTA1 like protein n=1 Tax=Schizopora paradoxa TaxID=27342 RepID=A0A0H2S5W0_9AGAM|nr:RTA1 like protein [Schizopora paradoxa]
MAPFTPPPGFDVKTDSPYHYIPTPWICVTFISLFGATTFVHLVEAFYFRLWWLLPTVVLAGIGEILGWAARYWSSFSDGTLNTPFMIQICTTIIAPTPLLAAYFIILGRLIKQLGPQYSRITPKRYTVIFCSADVTALFIQAAGGGIASSSTDPTFGGDIMLVGIALQLVFLCLFLALGTEFFVRLIRDKPFRRSTKGIGNMIELGSTDKLVHSDSSFYAEGTSAGFSGKPRLPKDTAWFVRGALVSCVFLFVRAIYRLIELSDGWNGPVISTQWLFNTFDAAMVFLAMFILCLLHPGLLLDLKAQ